MHHLVNLERLNWNNNSNYGTAKEKKRISRDIKLSLEFVQTIDREKEQKVSEWYVLWLLRDRS